MIECLGKPPSAFALYKDRKRKEGEHGVTTACTTTESFTDKRHHIITDTPELTDVSKNMTTGALHVDTVPIMIPADGNSTTAIAKDNHKASGIQGWIRQHPRSINLLGVKQTRIGANKMDCDTGGYKQERYNETPNDVRSMSTKIGWNEFFTKVKDVITDLVNRLQTKGLCPTVMKRCQRPQGRSRIQQ